MCHLFKRLYNLDCFVLHNGHSTCCLNQFLIHDTCISCLQLFNFIVFLFSYEAKHIQLLYLFLGVIGLGDVSEYFG